MATGFLAAGVHSTQITKNEVEKHRYDELDDMLATIGTAMLGLTVGCCPLPRPQVRPDPAARLLPHALDVHHDRPHARSTSTSIRPATSKAKAAFDASTHRLCRRCDEVRDGATARRASRRGRRPRASKADPRPAWVLPEHHRDEVGRRRDVHEAGRRQRAGRRQEPADRDATRSRSTTDLNEHHRRSARSAARTRRWSRAARAGPRNGNFALTDFTRDRAAPKSDRQKRRSR